jgi:hypothetical protein
MDLNLLRPGHPLRSSLGRLAREAKCHADIARARGKISVAFLPSRGPEVGASLLRAYSISESLGDLGFRCLLVPPHLSQSQRGRLLKRFQPDIVIAQSGRHDLNRRQYLDRWNYVLDMDDADFLAPGSEFLDDLAAGAVGMIAGSRYIADWGARWQPNVEVIWTGTPRVMKTCSPPSTRAPLVTWAQSDPIAYWREREFVADVLLRVLERRDSVMLRLYGWREDFERSALGRLNDPRIHLQLQAQLPYDRFVASLSDAAVGLSPIIPESLFSRGKSFGKILAYLEARVPVICSDEADHALAFEDGGAIVSNDPDFWADRIVSLLGNPAERDQLADKADEVFNEKLSLEVSARRTAEFLERTIHSLPR